MKMKEGERCRVESIIELFCDNKDAVYSVCITVIVVCLQSSNTVRWEEQIRPVKCFSQILLDSNPVAKFIVPDWGIQLTPVLGCRTGLPSYVAWRAGYENHVLESTLSLQSGTMNLATGCCLPSHAHSPLKPQNGSY